MTMEYKRSAVWQAATQSRAGLWLGVSKLRSAPTLRSGASPRVSAIHSESAQRLIAGSLGGRSFSSDINLVCSSGVSTPEVSLSRFSTIPLGHVARISSHLRQRRLFRVLDSSRFAAKNAKTASSCRLLLASNQPPFPGISNREHHLLGRALTYRKQRTAPGSNRELSTNRYTSNCRQTGQRQRDSPPVTGDLGARLFGFLTGTDLQTETAVTLSKQMVGKILTGTRT
jgi:hypothetical protein